MRNLSQTQFGTGMTEIAPDHHVYKVHLPAGDPLPYDEDPNNSTSPMRPPHAFAKGALRPMKGKPYGRNHEQDQ
jgi:hypothetical protein